MSSRCSLRRFGRGSRVGAGARHFVHWSVPEIYEVSRDDWMVPTPLPRHQSATWPEEGERERQAEAVFIRKSL